MLVLLEPLVHYQVNNGALSFFIRIWVHVLGAMHACRHTHMCAGMWEIVVFARPSCELRDARQQVALELVLQPGKKFDRFLLWTNWRVAIITRVSLDTLEPWNTLATPIGVEHYLASFEFLARFITVTFNEMNRSVDNQWLQSFQLKYTFRPMTGLEEYFSDNTQTLCLLNAA